MRPMNPMKNTLRTLTVVLIAGIPMTGASVLGALQDQERQPPPRKTGLLRHHEGAFEGYTLFAPTFSTITYLIDMGGNVVHTWKGKAGPGQSVYLLENGHLLRCERSPDNKVFQVGGGGGVVREYTWEGEQVWEYVYSNDLYLQHHDIEPLPDGHVLILAWYRKNADEVVGAGRDPKTMTAGELWSEHVIEVEPVRPQGGNITWEWHAWDHLIQDHDPEKANYGNPAEHPERIDINAGARPRELSPDEQRRLQDLGYIAPPTGGRRGRGDWLHINSIHYNAELDQILLSVRHWSEIWIIDHSTVSSQAAGHTGGASGRGGDLLYRWGNPQMYRIGTAADQQLFNQHDAQWIEEGCPGAGNILVFNNGAGRRDGYYSSVDEIAPEVDENGLYTRPEGGAFPPSKPCWSYTDPDKSNFFSGFISGAQRLPNGNTLICSGEQGRLFEVKPDGAIVWEYVIPFSRPMNPHFSGRVAQGFTPPPQGTNAGGTGPGGAGSPSFGRPFPGGPGGRGGVAGAFRATRLPPDHPGLAGRKLEPVAEADLPKDE
ncbi:MAG: aryl-sulfate sulfotransferase [Planctomycetota bacterium]